MPLAFVHVFARFRTFLIWLLRSQDTLGGIAAAISVSTTDVRLCVSIGHIRRAEKRRVEGLSPHLSGHSGTFFIEYSYNYCVASSLFVVNGAHNSLLLGFPDRYGHNLWMYQVGCYIWVFFPYLGYKVLPCSVI